MKVTARFVKPLLFLAIILVASFLFPKNAFAKLSNCTVSLDTPIVDINSTTNVVFEITNTDDNNGRMVWVNVAVPSGSEFTIQDSGSSKSFNGFDVGPNNYIDESIAVLAGANAESSQSWVIQASDDPNGANSITCSGDTGMSIVDPAASAPPQITGVTISNVSNITATISFTTDQDSTAELDYGLDGSYGSTQNDSNSSGSHSFSLSGLTANTTYHYDLKATNGNGTSELGDHAFTTATTPSVITQTQTVTVTSTTTVTNTKIVSPTPTPTPIPDRTPPIVYIDNNFAKPFLVAPKITGTVTDNKAVQKVEYSLDGGKDWLPVDQSSTPGLASMTYSFLPISLDDGNYDLKIRAFDTSNNIGYSETQTMVIDRLPPQVSGVLFSIGPQIINPQPNGNVVMLADQKFKINLSEVGGTISLNLLATGSGTTKTFAMTKDLDDGLWSTTMSLGKGEYQLSFDAVDGAGNDTKRNLNKIITINKGIISANGQGVANANVTVYFQEPVTNQWQVWDGSAYSENNSQKTDANGGYNLFLPPGKYYLQIDGYGLKTIDTQFFTVDQAEAINANFKLSNLKLLLALGTIKIYWPDFSTLTVPFVNNLPTLNGVSRFVGKPMLFFNLSVNGQNNFSSDSLTGKPSVLTFLNTWSPSSTEQVSVLDRFAKNKDFNSVVIVEGEKLSKVTVFKKRGNYTLAINADPDATLTIPYSLSSLPVHCFLDRKGIVQAVIYGSLSEEELANTLINISQ